ncbi:hypothetical protein LCGC14_1161060 [marine sediment metagenome]|uniref:Uncharacterized protein n=1 Tax=marine sediment metagenome TaxID=412755 RepID=A0A0F9PY85_9ZZZZ
MARTLNQAIQTQITNQDIKIAHVFKINGANRTSYLLNWSSSYNSRFGAASAIFALDNNDGEFGNGGNRQINVGDTIELIERFEGDGTDFTKFYGIVEQRSIRKNANNRTITLNCLDYIATLQKWGIDLTSEGVRVEVTDEVLSPVYLDAPNDAMAQLFNFQNDALATHPAPLIRINDKNHPGNRDSQYDGYEIYYDVGQLKLGSSLNVRDNYEILATYSYYVKGKYVEDVIEEIIKLTNGYGGFLFGQPSSTHVVDLNLTTSFYNEEGTTTDILVPNLLSVMLTIETTLAQDYGAGANALFISDTTGFPEPESGQTATASVKGDSFTYTGIDSGNSLTGISGLGNHNSGDYCSYETTYAAGQIWYLDYSNLVSTLTGADFTIPGASMSYFDKRGNNNGSYIILDSPISIGALVTCNSDYTFKTLQATGIQINKAIFREREIENRMEAIRKLKGYLAPNYIIRTQGDNKIWASYLEQKTTADYTLNLISGANYLEDQDLYTRTLMWAKNENPTNLMFGDDVDYSSDEEDEYTGTANQIELSYFGEEKSGILSDWAVGQLAEAELLHISTTQNLINDIQFTMIDTDYASQDSTGYHVFGTPLTGVGKIILDTVTPTVFINGVPIDNQVHQMTAVPIKVRQTTKTIVQGGGKSKSVSTTTYYTYEVLFPHASITPDEPIYLYDNQGILQYTISPNDPNVDYGAGVWIIPGIERNDVAEVLATATYHVLYSSNKLIIEYNDVIFKIHKSILPEPDQVLVKASFEYWAIAIAVRDINAIVDGRRDTQLQIEFFGEPPEGFHLATIDLGATYTIQAIDIVAGFFKPDESRKFDIGFRMSLQYSTDNTNFYSISDKTEGFSLTAGEGITFEEPDLGSGLEVRYLKFVLDEVDRIDYGRGRYVVALTEISVYDDIILESEAKLIATTTLSQNVSPGATNIAVANTEGFTEPDSGATATAYLDKNSDKSFTYTGLESGNTFTGVTLESAVSANSGEYVTQTIAGDKTVYDNGGLLPNLGDRLFKKVLISDRNLYNQSELDTVSKGFLTEFQKNHSKIQIEILYAPYLKVGQTVSVTDAYNNISSQRYFIDSISDRNGNYNLILAQYP